MNYTMRYLPGLASKLLRIRKSLSFNSNCFSTASGYKQDVTTSRRGGGVNRGSSRDEEDSGGDPFGLESEDVESLRLLYQGLYSNTHPLPNSSKIKLDTETRGYEASQSTSEPSPQEPSPRLNEYQQWIDDKKSSKKPPLAELFRKTNYGSIRLDHENIVKVHGQYDEDIQRDDFSEISNLLKQGSPRHQQDVRKKSRAKDDEEIGQVEAITERSNKKEPEAINEENLSSTYTSSPQELIPPPLRQVKKIREQKEALKKDSSAQSQVKKAKANEVEEKKSESEEDTGPKTAAEYLRTNKEKILKILEKTPAAEIIDKQNPHIPKAYQPVNFNNLTHADMWDYLRNVIIFQDDNVVAINKPLGISIHDSTQSCRHRITDFLDDIAKFCGTEKIHPLHRLDKDTTGALLFAKNEKASKIIRQKFADRQIHKVYLVIAKNAPELEQGKINIPISEGYIADTTERRAVLRPNLQEYKIHTKQEEAKMAITNYRVIKSREHSSFLEVIPETGVKHQIRAHLAFAIGCPVLGDHKYSHPSKLAPQRLGSDVLDKMNIKQSKARHIPMHLHCHKISFFMPPEFGSKEVLIHARVPHYFMYTLKTLKLK